MKTFFFMMSLNVFLLSSMQAMPPLPGREGFLEGSQDAEQAAENRRAEEERDYTLNDRREERGDSGQFSRGEIESSMKSDSSRKSAGEQKKVRAVAFGENSEKYFSASEGKKENSLPVSAEVASGSDLNRENGDNNSSVGKGWVMVEKKDVLRLAEETAKKKQDFMSLARELVLDYWEPLFGYYGEQNDFPGYEEIAEPFAGVMQIRGEILEREKELKSNKAKLKCLRQDELDEYSRWGNDPDALAEQIIIREKLEELNEAPTAGSIKAIQIAQVYAENYPQVRKLAQQMLDFIQGDIARRNQATSLKLVDTAIQALEMASKTVAHRETEPIKRIKSVASTLKWPLDPPYEEMDFKPYEKYKLPSEDLEHDITAVTANFAFANLKRIKKIFTMIWKQSAPAEIGKKLREDQIERLNQEIFLSGQKTSYFDAKRREGNMFRVYPEEKAVYDMIKAKEEELRKLKDSEPLDDLTTIKRVAVEESLLLVQSGLQCADDLRDMLQQRKIEEQESK